MKIFILIAIFLIVQLVKSSHYFSINLNRNELGRYGSNMSKYIDNTVKPCDNFYQYACGKWHKYHKVPSGHDRISETELMNNIINENLHELLSVIQTSNDNKVYNQAKNFYASCMDTNILENRGTRPIKEFIKKSGGMPALSHRWDELNFSFAKLISDLKEYHGIDILLGVQISNDIRNPQNLILYVGETPLSHFPRNYYFDRRYHSKIEKYQSMMLKYLQKLGIEYGVAIKLARQFLELERDILKGNLIESNNILIRTNITDLKRRYSSSVIDFHDFIHRAVGFNAPGSTEVIETNRNYVTSLLDVVQRTPKQLLTNYVMYKVAEIFMLKNYDINGNLIVGEKRIPYCIELTKKYFPKIIDRMYFDKYKNLAIQAELNLITKYLKEAIMAKSYTENIDMWRYDLKSIRTEFLKYDDRELDAHDITYFEMGQQDFYGNIEKMMSFSLKIWRNNYQRKIADVFQIKPLEINAYYFPDLKAIKIPVTAVQHPFYNANYPKAMNFARLGVYLARAFTNVIQSYRQNSNDIGILKDWWKQDDNIYTNNGFIDEKLNCIHNQIRYEHLIENVSEDESFAVSFGVKTAFRAYLYYLNSLNTTSPTNKDILQHETLFGFDHSNTQLFFITYAQNWCEASKDKEKSLKILPSLSNFDEFSREFRCSHGSWMNPRVKCPGW